MTATSKSWSEPGVGSRGGARFGRFNRQSVGLSHSAGALASIWWFRERRMAGLRKQMRLLHSLGEQVIGATSSTEILRRLMLNLPALSQATGVGLYIHNRSTKTLEGVHSNDSAV